MVTILWMSIFFSRIGLPEGHVLSPIMFVLYVGDLELEQLEDEIWIVRKDGTKIGIPFIFYCDDLQEVDNEYDLKGYDCCEDVNGNYCHCKKCGAKMGFNHICRELYMMNNWY